LDQIVSSLGSLGSLAADLKARDAGHVSIDLAQLAVESRGVESAVSQILSRYVSSDQVSGFFESADSWLGTLADIIDLPEKYELLKGLTLATFNAPTTSWNRLDVVVTDQSPAITSVSPSVLTGLPLPQTQLLHIYGSGFTGSSTLLFNGSIASDPTRLYFISANEIDYYIRTDTNAANWTVRVINGSQQSNLGYFTVNAPPATPSGSLVVNLSPPGAVSAGAQWQADGGSYYSSGGVIPVLTPGQHTISFKPVSGYTTPASQTVTINANAQATASASYTTIAPSTGSITVNITPSGAVSAGAQ
jgi:hypothetical protein